VTKLCIALIGMAVGGLAGGALADSGGPESKGSAASLARVDHIVYGTPDLQLGIDTLEKLLGVRATPGGQHPGRGTRNALIALGPATYLEIIAPDPQQPKPAAPRSFGIDDLRAPRLVAWAAKGKDLEPAVAEARRQGVPLGDVRAGSRKRPDGVLLSWRYSDPAAVVAGGVVPFLIDWGSSPHPAATAAQGASLIALRVETPTPEPVHKMLQALGFDLPVQKGLAPAIVATIRTARGTVELR